MCMHIDSTEEPHACPFQEDVNGNYDEDYCNCCPSCEHECCMDI